MNASIVHRRSRASSFRIFSQDPSPLLHVYLTRESDGVINPVTGLSAASAYQAYYIAPGNSVPVPFGLSGSLAGDEECEFREIDPGLMPGVYSLLVPACMRAPGYTFVRLQFTAALPLNLRIHAVDYDPCDVFALGLGTWRRVNCNDNLTGGLRKSMPAILRPLLAGELNR